MEQFLADLQKNYPLSDANGKLLLQHMEETSFPKGSLIVEEGQRNLYAYFMKQGFCRAYANREDREITLWFAGEGELAVLIPGSTPAPISTVNIQALENCVTLRISREKMESLFEESIELANWGRRLVESFLLDYEHYFINYSWTDAKQQYETLIKEYPRLLQKASLKQIASYLSITPQSLSRIRASIK